MPEPFRLTTCCLHYPLTTLLLLATVWVDAVAILIADIRDPIAGVALYAFFLAQLTLIAWWATSAGKFAWSRFLILGAGIAGLAIWFGSPDIGVSKQIFAQLFVHIILVVLASWLAWRWWGSKRTLHPQRRQFSLKQLIGLTTLCAILAAVSRYADFASFTHGDFQFLIAVGNVLVLGVAAPGLIFFSHWPLYVRWMLPLLFALAMGFVMSFVVSDNRFDYWNFNIISAATYSIYGLCIAADSQSHSSSTPDPQLEA